MAQQFTWQQFLIATLTFTFIWYLAVVLIFYRKELHDFLKGTGKLESNREPLPHRWENETEILENQPQDELLGKSKLPDGIAIVTTGDFSFAGSREDDKVGLVPDVLEEIKQVFQLLVKTDGNKKDFFRLMAEVGKNYPRLGSNPNLGKINEFIVDHAPFHLSMEELENLWY